MRAGSRVTVPPLVVALPGGGDPMHRAEGRWEAALSRSLWPLLGQNVRDRATHTDHQDEREPGKAAGRAAKHNPTPPSRPSASMMLQSGETCAVPRGSPQTDYSRIRVRRALRARAGIGCAGGRLRCRRRVRAWCRLGKLGARHRPRKPRVGHGRGKVGRRRFCHGWVPMLGKHDEATQPPPMPSMGSRSSPAASVFCRECWQREFGAGSRKACRVAGLPMMLSWVRVPSPASNRSKSRLAGRARRGARRSGGEAPCAGRRSLAPGRRASEGAPRSARRGRRGRSRCARGVAVVARKPLAPRARARRGACRSRCRSGRRRRRMTRGTEHAAYRYECRSSRRRREHALSPRARRLRDQPSPYA